MKASISLEFIGANSYDYVRAGERRLELAGVRLDPEDKMRGGPAVAELLSDGPFVRRRWLHGRRDYSHANSKGSRGITMNYVLEENKLYWVQEPKSWKSTVRYYAAVTAAGDVRILTAEEAQEWLNAL